ncbi:acyl-CoA dehydrogenase family protein [Amycolatopsis palatopharyngis]|uniref:acyl-CoA dehydrogenase family protein n=1 Tax=Amycolatopsis palatopharyngis TaxID=187982 RepID=UPI000E256CCA|nr:acyl-CoA dehydrogenase family protein [Amycolatopsis palatopharyngis]
MNTIDAALTDEQRAARELALRFATEQVAPRAAEIDRDDVFPQDLYTRMADLGLLGINIPEEYGGSGADELTTCLIMEELARRSGTVANALLLAKLQSELIMRAGNEDQRRNYVPDIVSGRRICLIAVTEPDAGTDVASIRTTATRQDGGWVLNGTKAFMTAGAVGDVAVVLARTSSDPGNASLTTFLVEKSPNGDPGRGFVVGHKDELMGMRGLGTAGIVLQNTVVADSAVLGETGRGFQNVMRSFDNGRIVIACLALGLAVGALDASLTYARERVAFGRTIENFQAVQLMLADMVVDTQAARLLIHHAAQMKDQGRSYSSEASMAKLFASDIAVRTAANAVQVHGGYGYTKEAVVERIYRDAKLTQIYEGTNQIQRVIISRDALQGRSGGSGTSRTNNASKESKRA